MKTGRKSAIIIGLGVAVGAVLFLFFAAGTKEKIRLGGSLPLSGVNRSLGEEVYRGARAAFSDPNASRRIEWIVYDDQYEPRLTRENLDRLLERDHIDALFGLVGTPTIRAVLPRILRKDLLLVAPISGAGFLLNPGVVNFRPRYAREVAEIVRHLVEERGLKRIAVLYQNDDYGEDGYVSTLQELARRGLAPVAEGVYRRNTYALEQALTEIGSSDAQAVILVGATRPVAHFIREYRRRFGSDTIFCPLSFVDADALIEELSFRGEGVLFSQVVPYYASGHPLAKTYREIFERLYPGVPLGFVSFEAYLSARITAEAIGEIRGAFDREEFRRALQRVGESYRKQGLIGTVHLFFYEKGRFRLVEEKR